MSARAERPRRPSLGVFFPAACSAWAAVVAVEHVSWCAYVRNGGGARVVALATLLSAATAIAVLVAVRRLRGRGAAVAVFRTALPSVVALLCAAACASLSWQAWSADVAWVQGLPGGADGLRVGLTGDPVTHDYGTVSAARVRHGVRSCAVRFLWPRDARPVCAGHALLARGRVSRPSDGESGRYCHRNGYAGTLYASSVVEDGYAGGLRGLVAPFRDASFERVTALGGEGVGIVAGVLLGNRTLYAGSELEQDFRVTGLAHLMAVSGTHLAVVAMLVGWLLARTPLPRRARDACVGVLMVLYVSLTCFAPSAVRACVMCVCALAASAARRRGHVAGALGLCVLCYLCLAPEVAFSLGFRLSVLAVLGLVAVGPLLSAWAASLLPARLRPLGDPLAATLAANLATLPVTVPLFAQLPLVSPVSTLLVSPLVTVVLVVGMPALVAAAALPALCAPLLAAAGAVAGACACLVHLLADLPFACVPLRSSAPVLSMACAGIAIVLWARWPLPAGGGEADASSRAGVPAVLGAPAVLLLAAVPTAALLCGGLGGFAGCAGAFGVTASQEAQVVMLDVGQGDSMLVRDGTSAVLVDTGEFGDVLKRQLAAQGVTHLDAVYLTHGDADHAGALSALAGVVSVDHVFVHADLLGSTRMRGVLRAASWATAGRGAQGVRPGATAHVGRFTLRLLAPQEGGDGGNADSLVNLVEFDADADGRPDARGLVGGDAEAAELEPLVADVGDVDFVKVGHHGSAGAFTSGQLEVLRPEIALISCGAGNEYGHPTAETLSLLADARVKVYRTDLQGALRMGFSKGHVEVHVEREAGPEALARPG